MKMYSRLQTEMATKVVVVSKTIRCGFESCQAGMITIMVYRNDDFLPEFVITKLNDLGKTIYNIINKKNFGQISIILWKN